MSQRTLAAWNAQQDEWRDAGLCTACGEPAAEGRKLCDEHLRYHRDLAKSKREDRRAAGQCLECGREAEAGKPLCEEHSRRARERRQMVQARAEAARRGAEKYRAGKKAAGLCIRRRCQLVASAGDICAVHADPDFIRKYNAERMRELQAKRMTSGLCVKCGFKSDRPTRTTCSDCRLNDQEKMNEVVAERRASGLCRCGRPVRKYARCTRCRRAARRLQSRYRRRRLRAGLCCRCRNPRDGEHTLCAEHRAQLAADETRRKLRKAGVVFKERK